MILDTSFIVDVLRGENNDVKNKTLELDKKFEVKAVTSITIMELWRGAMLSNAQTKEKEKINEILDSVLIYNFTEREAKKAAEIESGLIQQGKRIEIEDIMIASIALIRNEKILTRNIKHFQDIKGLSIESY